MEGKKYKLSKETKNCDGYILHRIEALKNFMNVRVGKKGGWVESEKNLSQEGDCWVYENAKVFGKAKVLENARVHDNAIVTSNAKISGNAIVLGNALIADNALILDHAKVCENALVVGNAKVYEAAVILGNVEVSGNALVSGTAIVSGKAQISNNANIKSITDFLCINPIGGRNDSVTFYKTVEGIHVVVGCFNDRIEAFEQAVQETHGNNEYAEQYSAAIQLAKVSILNGKMIKN